MNYTQSFEEFSKSLGPTDLVLYAGIGLFLWVLFKDKISPVQNLVSSVIGRVKNLLKVEYKVKPEAALAQPVPASVSTPVLADSLKQQTNEDRFFKLIVSWKQTRDLAEQCNCGKAVEVADSMFPYLSPNVCGKDTNNA